MAPPKLPKRNRPDDDDSEDIHLTKDGDIKTLLLSLSSKMDSLCGTMTDVDNRLNVRMDGLESSLSKLVGDVKEDMEKKLSSFSADIDKRFHDVIASTNQKCEETAAQVSSDLLNRVDEMRALYEFKLDKLERNSLDKELIITGITMEQNDSPLSVVGDIVHALNCNLRERDFTAAFRLKRNGAASNRPIPIVVRVYDNNVKQELLSCYFKRKNLNLKDIGFKTSARIFINESLTKLNREIFNLASEAKKANHVVKLFTRNGRVYVQRNANDKPICIQHISDLEQFLPPTFDRVSSSNSLPIRQRWTHSLHQSNPSLNPHANPPVNTPLPNSGSKTLEESVGETSMSQPINPQLQTN